MTITPMVTGNQSYEPVVEIREFGRQREDDGENVE